MSDQPATIPNDLTRLPKLPSWVTSGPVHTSDIVAFRSGAALMALDALVTDPTYGVPARLLANRLALRAATVTSKLEGRLVQEADIRDAYHLSPPGAARGPDGDLLAFWRDAIRRPADKHTELEALGGSGFADKVGGWLDAAVERSRVQGPLVGGAAIIRMVLEADDRAERVACHLSDVVLARALDWKTCLPLSARHLTKAALHDLVVGAQGADLAVQAQILRSVEDTTRLARDLARRADALRALAPKLRAKGSDAAVNLFLTEDAVAPASTLSPRIGGTSISMTSRAARRFCDRLVELGLAQELTGRPTFRLYGITP